LRRRPEPLCRTPALMRRRPEPLCRTPAPLRRRSGAVAANPGPGVATKKPLWGRAEPLCRTNGMGLSHPGSASPEGGTELRAGKNGAERRRAPPRRIANGAQRHCQARAGNGPPNGPT
jgi:hypothetical protein